MKKIICLAVIAFGGVLSGHAQQTSPPKAVNVIFDTDMGPDYDDVGAITLLHYYASTGQAKILATMASTKYPRVVPVLNILNTYFNQPEIPIGVPKGNASELFDTQKWSDSLVVKYPHQLKANADAPDAIKLYRKILAQQPANSVVIVTVGFFNNIAGLLQSPPDEYSPLSGQALVNQKVLKMVSMAGGFPSGREFNMDQQAEATKYVFDHWERPVIFSGVEIGNNIKSGLPLIHNKTIKNSPVKDVYKIAIPLAKGDAAGRMSWDQTTVLVAIQGYKPYFRLQRGKVVVAKDGSNTWVDSKSGNHYYLVPVRPAKEIENVINNLMIHQPEK